MKKIIFILLSICVLTSAFPMISNATAFIGPADVNPGIFEILGGRGVRIEGEVTDIIGGKSIGFKSITFTRGSLYPNEEEEDFDLYYTLDGSDPLGGKLLEDNQLLLMEAGTYNIRVSTTESFPEKREYNNTITVEQLSTPQISADVSGVSITSEEGASIYCTVDGTTPDENSPLYDGEFVVIFHGEPVTVKAIAVKNGYVSSDIAEFQIEEPLGSNMIEIECLYCNGIFEVAEEIYHENANIHCPYCDESFDFAEEDAGKDDVAEDEEMAANETAEDESNDDIIEIKCLNCKKMFEDTEEIYDEHGNVICPYCGKFAYYTSEETGDDENTADEDEEIPDEEVQDDEVAEDEMMEEESAEDEMPDGISKMECPGCKGIFEDTDDIYDENGNVVCPYCGKLIDGGEGDVADKAEEEAADGVGDGQLKEMDFVTSDWAEIEVNESYVNGLIPAEMLNDILYHTITREEFAAIAVKLYASIVGEVPYVEISDTPFTDCNGYSSYADYIGAAYKLGITMGTSENTFSPYELISREQLATMLFRVIKIAEAKGLYTMETGFDANNVRKFADDADISDYAKESVYFMAEYGIIKGMDGANFAPRNVTYEQQQTGYATATKEQALLITNRIVNNLF